MLEFLVNTVKKHSLQIKRTQIISNESIVLKNNITKYMGDLKERLRRHLKNFTSEELRKEINIVRHRFKTRGLKREELMIILSYPQLFKHASIKYESG